jgi:SAM-dependent methyltransferase
LGCRVDGIDISRARVRDAIALTQLVSLSHLVSIRRGDITTAPVPVRNYDVILGLSAWMHVDDPRDLIWRWSRALKQRGGRLVIQDACLMRLPNDPTERGLITRLQRDWAGRLHEAAQWAAFATAAGLHVTTLRRSSRAMTAHFTRLLATSHRTECVPIRELRSWRDAIDAAERRLVGSFMLIARR